jgi:hypothetical protein
MLTADHGPAVSGVSKLDKDGLGMNDWHWLFIIIIF